MDEGNFLISRKCFALSFQLLQDQIEAVSRAAESRKKSSGVRKNIDSHLFIQLTGIEIHQFLEEYLGRENA